MFVLQMMIEGELWALTVILFVSYIPYTQNTMNQGKGSGKNNRPAPKSATKNLAKAASLGVPLGHVCYSFQYRRPSELAIPVMEYK